MEMIDSSVLDPELVEVIRTLNQVEYKTEASCAGHPENEGAVNIGYILFTREYPHSKIRKILMGHGLRDVNLGIYSSPWLLPRSCAIFESLGGERQIDIYEPGHILEGRRSPSKGEIEKWRKKHGLPRERIR